MKKNIIIIYIIVLLNTAISCTDNEELFVQHGEGEVPLWISEVKIIDNLANEYLVAYTSKEELEIKEGDSDYSLSTYMISLFSIRNKNTKIWDFYNYGMTEKALKSNVYFNEKLKLDDFNNFFFLYDLNLNGRPEIIYPLHAGGGQVYLQILEYNEVSNELEVLLNQKFDPTFNYALQTVEFEGVKLLKVFPDYGNETREKIDEGIFKQKYLIFGWNESDRNYTAIESGYENVLLKDLHW